MDIIGLAWHKNKPIRRRSITPELHAGPKSSEDFGPARSSGVRTSSFYHTCVRQLSRHRAVYEEKLLCIMPLHFAGVVHRIRNIAVSCQPRCFRLRNAATDSIWVCRGVEEPALPPHGEQAQAQGGDHQPRLGRPIFSGPGIKHLSRFDRLQLIAIPEALSLQTVWRDRKGPLHVDFMIRAVSSPKPRLFSLHDFNLDHLPLLCRREVGHPPSPTLSRRPPAISVSNLQLHSPERTSCLSPRLFEPPRSRRPTSNCTSSSYTPAASRSPAANSGRSSRTVVTSVTGTSNSRTVWPARSKNCSRRVCSGN